MKFQPSIVLNHSYTYLLNSLFSLTNARAFFMSLSYSNLFSCVNRVFQHAISYAQHRKVVALLTCVTCNQLGLVKFRINKNFWLYNVCSVKTNIRSHLRCFSNYMETATRRKQETYICGMCTKRITYIGLVCLKILEKLYIRGFFVHVHVLHPQAYNESHRKAT